VLWGGIHVTGLIEKLPAPVAVVFGTAPCTGAVTVIAAARGIMLIEPFDVFTLISPLGSVTPPCATLKPSVASLCGAFGNIWNVSLISILASVIGPVKLKNVIRMLLGAVRTTFNGNNPPGFSKSLSLKDRRALSNPRLSDPPVMFEFASTLMLTVTLSPCSPEVDETERVGSPGAATTDTW